MLLLLLTPLLEAIDKGVGGMGVPRSTFTSLFLGPKTDSRQPDIACPIFSCGGGCGGVDGWRVVGSCGGGKMEGCSYGVGWLSSWMEGRMAMELDGRL